MIHFLKEMSSAIPSFPTAGLECIASCTFVLLAPTVLHEPVREVPVPLAPRVTLGTNQSQPLPLNCCTSQTLPEFILSKPATGPCKHLIFCSTTTLFPPPCTSVSAQRAEKLLEKRSIIPISYISMEKKRKIPNSQHLGHLKWKANMTPPSTCMRCPCLNLVNMELGGFRRTE